MGKAATKPMISFSVFFDGPLGFGIQPDDAVDSDHAIEIVSAMHPGARLAAVETSEIVGCNKHRLLAGWITGKVIVKGN
jgi:hypothetical protein